MADFNLGSERIPCIYVKLKYANIAFTKHVSRPTFLKNSLKAVNLLPVQQYPVEKAGFLVLMIAARNLPNVSRILYEKVKVRDCQCI